MTRWRRLVGAAKLAVAVVLILLPLAIVCWVGVPPWEP